MAVHVPATSAAPVVAVSPVILSAALDPQTRAQVVHRLSVQGSELRQYKKLREALVIFMQALALDHSNVSVLTNTANIYYELGEMETAVEYYRGLLFRDSNNVLLLTSIGNACQCLGRLDMAISHFERALQLDPNCVPTVCPYVFALMSVCNWKHYDRLMATLLRMVNEQLTASRPPSLLPFHCFLYPLPEEVILAICQRQAEWAKRACNPDVSFPIQPKTGSRLRVGFVSSDFGNHPLSHLMRNVFGFFDRSRTEVFCYALSSDDGSKYRQHISTTVEHFVELLDAQRAAERIYCDNIQVLVDLNGYTKGCMTEIFAYRPAPVQAHYMGYAGTLGSDFIEYIITDKIASPPDLSTIYSEQMCYMPHSYYVNDYAQTYSRTLLPSEEELNELGRVYLPNVNRKNTFIFANFNKLMKVDPYIFSSWMRILRRVPTSILWLLRFPAQAECNLRNEALARGVHPTRLVFTNTVDKDEHVRRCRLADLFLDTRGYTAHTTATDVLWALVPYVTFPERKMSSRVAASIASAAGLADDMVASSLQDFEDRAVYLATHPEALSKLKARVMSARNTSPVFDTKRWVRSLNDGLEQMWANFETGEKPRSIRARDFSPSKDFGDL